MTMSNADICLEYKQATRNSKSQSGGTGGHYMTKDKAIEILEFCLDGAEAAEAYWAAQEGHEEEAYDVAEEAEAYRMAIQALGGDA